MMACPRRMSGRAAWPGKSFEPENRTCRAKVGGAEHGSAIGNNLRTLFGIDRVRIASLLAGSGLYDDLEPGLEQIGNYDGNERNPAFAGITFFRNSNNHAALVLSPT